MSNTKYGETTTGSKTNWLIPLLVLRLMPFICDDDDVNDGGDV